MTTGKSLADVIIDIVVVEVNPHSNRTGCLLKDIYRLSLEVSMEKQLFMTR